MVAYSFQPRFVRPILAGTKRQTIRADRKRHARPGEEVQLYTGMRTKHCRLIARVRCIGIERVTLLFAAEPEHDGVFLALGPVRGGLEAFARDDGFGCWADLKAFWRTHHPGMDEFSGWLIRSETR